MNDWRPIETAPKDDTYVLLWFPTGPAAAVDEYDHYKIGFWSTNSNDWFDVECANNPLTAYGDQPTHWMPLPPPPRSP